MRSFELGRQGQWRLLFNRLSVVQAQILLCVRRWMHCFLTLTDTLQNLQRFNASMCILARVTTAIASATWAASPVTLPDEQISEISLVIGDSLTVKKKPDVTITLTTFAHKGHRESAFFEPGHSHCYDLVHNWTIIKGNHYHRLGNGTGEYGSGPSSIQAMHHAFRLLIMRNLSSLAHTCRRL